MVLAGCAASRDEGFVILPGSLAGGLFPQCSRPAPSPTQYWTPSAVDVQSAEQHLQQVARKTWYSVSPREYLRQYAGIVVEDRKLLYVNALGAPGLREMALREPLRMCDGGSLFWGAIYDPSTQQYSDLEFNGTV